MAITEERLEQLIKQEKDVFILYDNDFIRKENTAQYNFRIDESVDFGGYVILNTDEYGTTLRYRLADVFETFEEAEHYVKYGNITKTVKMPVPPTYKEFLNKGLWFMVNNVIDIAEIDNNFLIFKGGSVVLRLPATEENYYKCLDKLVELWRKE